MNTQEPNRPEAPTGEPATHEVVYTPPASKPVVVYTLIVVTVLAFLLQLATQYLFSTKFDLLFALGGKVNELILRGQFWRLITPVFLHGSFLHIAFNMYALFSIGPSLEKHYGHNRFLILYFLAGFAGNVFSFLFTKNASLGASTAVFGLVAAEVVFIYRNRFLFGERSSRILTNLGLIIVVNLVLGLSPGIDNWGHLGGLLGGFAFAWFAGPLLGVEINLGRYLLTDRRLHRDVLWAAVVLLMGFSLLVALKFIL